MEICVHGGQVFINWTGVGPYLVVSRDGTVTEEFVVPPGEPVWTDDEPEDGDGTYDDGYQEGYEDALEEVRDAIPFGPPPRRRKPAPAASTPPRVATLTPAGSRP